MKMMNALKKLAESYIFILCLALMAGFLLPASKMLIPYNTLLLQAIFLISSLKLDVGELLKRGKDWKLLIVSNAILLILFPLVVRWLAPMIVPDLAFPLFLLALMPAGMTAPLLVEVVGGRQALALVVTVTSSLLAPFTIPLMIKFAYGTSVSVDVWSMCKNLLLIIVIPFALGLIIKKFAGKLVVTVNEHSKPFSLLLLGAVVASAISAHASDIVTSLTQGPELLWTLVILYIFFLAHHLIGYYGLWWEPREDRMTLSVCLTYMNFTLAIYLATTYFPDPKIILPLVLAILPWATLLPIWKKIDAAHVLP